MKEKDADCYECETMREKRFNEGEWERTGRNEIGRDEYGAIRM